MRCKLWTHSDGCLEFSRSNRYGIFSERLKDVSFVRLLEDALFISDIGIYFVIMYKWKRSSCNTLWNSERNITIICALREVLNFFLLIYQETRCSCRDWLLLALILSLTEHYDKSYRGLQKENFFNLKIMFREVTLSSGALIKFPIFLCLKGGIEFIAIKLSIKSIIEVTIWEQKCYSSRVLQITT
jgi:hypothetical protein